MIKKLFVPFMVAMAFSSLAHAATTVDIDFTGYGVGTAFTTQIPGVTFSVNGGPGPDGAPVIDGWGSNGLSNSVTGEYPTGAILDAKFSGLASNVKFDFNNYGSSSSDRGATFFSAFGTMGQLLETGMVGEGGSFSLISSGIADLKFNNNSSGDGSWLFDVTRLQATVSAVPEPESYAMMLGGLGLLGFMSRRRKTV